MTLVTYGGLWLFGAICVSGAVYNLVTYWISNKRVFFHAGVLMLFVAVFLGVLIVRFTPG